ncbi:hypothetical protein E4U21_000254 [Claviceps maximensis]|nr:hypothetical protein E4U21_000254 [Claviceps maximensis]
MSLDGEPGWVCLMCCNCDILFSAVVIQWVTSKDNAGTSMVTSSPGNSNGRDSQGLGSYRCPASGAGTSPDSSPLSDSGSMPLSNISRLGNKSTSNMQGNHSGVMVTTTIKVETKPESTAHLAMFSGDHRKPDSRAEAEEDRVEYDGSLPNQEFRGPRTSIIITGHGD